jgi:hypothetical protein
MLLTQKQPDQSSGLIGFLLKTGWEKGWKKGIKRKSHSVSKNTVYLDDPKERSHEQLICEASVQIHDKDTSGVFSATARNYTVVGMYLESDYAPRIGAGLVLGMIDHKAGSPTPEDISKYHSRLIWREKLSGNIVFMRYGIGVKHCQGLEEFLRLFGYWPERHLIISSIASASAKSVVFFSLIHVFPNHTGFVLTIHRSLS